MKKIFLLLVAIISLNGCDKDDDKPIAEIDKLPPATQTGANTFGCLLDGQVFLPGRGINPLDCVYQYVDGGYYFSLQANKEINSNLTLLGCSTQRLEIFQGQTYQLKEKKRWECLWNIFF